MRRLVVVGATTLAVAAAGSGSPAAATITGCGRVTDTDYSFRVIAHGEQAPSCRVARGLARRVVGGQTDRPLRVRGWSCTADHYYDGPWAFLCIRRHTNGQISIDHFRRLARVGGGCGAGVGDAFREIAGAVLRMLDTATLTA